MSNECIEFQGRRYIRWPESENRNDRVYFKCHIWPDSPRYLHRDIWESVNGPIPKGFAIHHVDGNPLNNGIKNLKCILLKEHASNHTCDLQQDKDYCRRTQLGLLKARNAAKSWHRSDAGRKWHSEHAKEIADNTPLIKKVCEQCGKEYYSKGRRKTDRFCSNACKTAWRYASGKDNISRKCLVCGKEFIINRYSRTKTCSRDCQGIMRKKAKG